MSDNLENLIEKIVDAERCFRRACSQIVVLNRQLADLQSRYDMAMKQHARAFRYSLRVRIAVLEGVRNMFYEFASMKADLIVELRKEIQREQEQCDHDESLDDSYYVYDDDEYDLSDSELEYSDFDFSDIDDDADEGAEYNMDASETGALNMSVLVVNANYTEKRPVSALPESVMTGSAITVEEKVPKETDLNGTEISIDSGYLDDSLADEEVL
ncbi:hypothetical protein DPMN_171460 [Dreissena polymorpha]|uniref:Uncharacterized protein n=1 Tax=Dreissena polymorpha TaxID=45954 RepID=A0A9D4E1R0_DREPO|nr:hypothetical protein DPMN_171460 [Dreissena polymorpha]